MKNTIINALVIDDNEVNIMILTNMLELFKIHVDQAYQGIEAVQLSQSKEYDIIFVDHIMPEMDGAQTTVAIRNILPHQQKPAIIALTSNITEDIINLYNKAGANDVYVKPLGILDLTSLLKKWCPKLQINKHPVEQEIPASSQKYEYIKAVIEHINGIDYASGIRFAAGNPERFMNILEVSIKDLQSCINIIINSRENNSVTQLQMGVHKLKSILTNIGAMELSEKTKLFEIIILEGTICKINQKYEDFIRSLEHFTERLCTALQTYFDSIQSALIMKEPTLPLMGKEECEQCVIKAIYYIRRYEYDSIVKVMEQLILRGCPKLRQEFEFTLKNIKEYNYEIALALMLKIKNETGNLPIPNINKNVQLESIWK